MKNVLVVTFSNLIQSPGVFPRRKIITGRVVAASPGKLRVFFDRATNDFEFRRSRPEFLRNIFEQLSSLNTKYEMMMGRKAFVFTTITTLLL